MSVAAWSAAPAGVQGAAGAQLCAVFRARQLELEDRQSRLQQELREKMAVDGNHFISSRLRNESFKIN